MPKPHKLIVAFLFFALALASFAFADDSVTITTYYPAPYGVYKEFETYSNTYLAHSSGNVGIGTSNPIGKLDLRGSLAVGGSVGTSGQVLQSQGAGVAPLWAAVTGGNVKVVNGPSCPAGYSSVLYYYQSRTCSAPGGCDPSVCTTQPGWGSETAIYQWGGQFSLVPDPNPIYMKPACIYKAIGGGSCYAQTCYAIVILRTLCATDSP